MIAAAIILMGLLIAAHFTAYLMQGRGKRRHDDAEPEQRVFAVSAPTGEEQAR